MTFLRLYHSFLLKNQENLLKVWTSIRKKFYYPFKKIENATKVAHLRFKAEAQPSVRREQENVESHRSKSLSQAQNKAPTTAIHWTNRLSKISSSLGFMGIAATYPTLLRLWSLIKIYSHNKILKLRTLPWTLLLTPNYFWVAKSWPRLLCL